MLSGILLSGLYLVIVAACASVRDERTTTVTPSVASRFDPDALEPVGLPSASSIERRRDTEKRSAHSIAPVPMIQIDTSQFGMPEAPPDLSIAPVGTEGNSSELGRVFSGSLHVADWGTYTVQEPASVPWPDPADFVGINEIAVWIGNSDERPERIEIRFFEAAIGSNGVPMHEPILTIECDMIAETCQTVLSSRSLGVIVPLPDSDGEYKLAVWAKWQDWRAWQESVDAGDSDGSSTRRAHAAWLFSLVK